ncbi:MAG: DNA-processing protein DprA [Arachnia sp.]
MNADRRARMALCALGAWGSPPLGRAVAEFGAEAVWEGLRAQGEETTFGRRAQTVDIAGIERASASCGARFLVPDDDEWPARLGALGTVELAGMGGEPAGLWASGGSLGAIDGAVAIVGARACTSYGEQAAMTLAADLAEAGHCVISGLAFGIDAAAHRGALGVRGGTVAVVAGGVDDPYPTANRRLAEAIARAGCVLSEAPPGWRPTKYAFLARNRLIAALSDAVVIVEAAARSGAKNTTSWGALLGRPVLAVPGPITSALSATPHRLVREGEAVLVTSSAEVREAISPLDPAAVPEGRGPRRPIDALERPLREVREALAPRESLTAGELARRTGQPVLDALAHAHELAEAGWLDLTEEGLFTLPRRRPRVHH